MPLAEIGPLTSLMQTIAAGIGAGMLLGGFATGVVGLVLAWPKRRGESSAVRVPGRGWPES